LVKLCALAVLTVPLSLLGQESGKRYDALKQALGLSDAQVSQLQQRTPLVLDDAQRAKLPAIQKVWDRWDAVAFAIQLGLIDEKLWPGGSATLCFYPIRASAYATELGLSESQLRQLDQLKEAARATHSRPPRDLALAVLDETQRGKVTAFETALQVANEAIELGLIPRPMHGEVLCH
jgi:hypothetical protein